MIRLLDELMNGVSINKMQDGDVAVVVEWTSADKVHVGDIVQRCDKMLIPLGKPSGKAYVTIFDGSSSHLHQRVRILGPGTELVLDE